MWFRKAPRDAATGTSQAITAFFHPLDGVLDWNRIYGSRGFVQYQFVVPYGAEAGRAHGARTAQRAAAARRSSRCSSASSTTAARCSASRCRAGRSRSTSPRPAAALTPLLDGLDELVVEAGGRVYLTKDARLRPELVPRDVPAARRVARGARRARSRARAAQRHGPPARPHRRVQVIGFEPAGEADRRARRACPTALPR